MTIPKWPAGNYVFSKVVLSFPTKIPTKNSYKTICTRDIPIMSLIHVGLNDIVPENLLSIFDENELEVCTVCIHVDGCIVCVSTLWPCTILQLLMCGLSEIDMDDWKSNSTVQGNDAHFQTVVSWFWTAASSYSQEERARYCYLLNKNASIKF